MANQRVQATFSSAPDPRRSVGKREAPRTASLYRAVGIEALGFKTALLSLEIFRNQKFSIFGSYGRETERGSRLNLLASCVEATTIYFRSVVLL